MGLTKLGPNTLSLGGVNTYSGTTTVAAGTLAIANTGALIGYNTLNKIKVNNSGTLALNVGGAGQWTEGNIVSLVGSNGSNFAPGSALGIDTTNATGGFFFGSSISGSMGLTVLGTNAMTLTASNGFTGSTTVSSGTLVLANTGAWVGAL